MATFFLGLLVGGLVSSAILLFIVGATRTERDNEVYMEGFNAGYEGRWGKDGKGGAEHEPSAEKEIAERAGEKIF